jgi:hypothetical protein
MNADTARIRGILKSIADGKWASESRDVADTFGLNFERSRYCLSLSLYNLRANLPISLDRAPYLIWRPLNKGLSLGIQLI